MRRLRIAIAGLTACSGCQLSLLNCEDELPRMLELFEFHYFPMASSPALMEGEYDAALVEGCVSMPHEKELLHELRRRSRYLIALGTCAACGGVAALRNGEEREPLRQKVYGESQVASETFEPLRLYRLVKVDATVTGCPPEKTELLRLLAGLIRGALPEEVDYPVCTECRMRENCCLLMERNMLCLGPLTLGGCGARCPSLGVPCEGCRGPVPEANLAEALEIYAEKGFDKVMVLDRLRRFCPGWKL
jgi:coenzyme F420-reducing hydrogenase gamma subunit